MDIKYHIRLSESIIELLHGDRFCNLGSIIIYCTRREQTDRVATIIRTCMNKGVPIETKGKRSRTKGLDLEWGAESYHAGLTPAKRKRVQNAFMSGRLRVVAATVAFGMGLDKSDVRGIIHYNMPKSFESYVQEIGRAGRDGEAAQCHVFLDPEGKDLCELRRHTYSNTVDYRTLKKLVLKVFPTCRCRDVHERHAQAVKAAANHDDDIAMETDDAFDDIISKETTMNDYETESRNKAENKEASLTSDNEILKTSERLCPGHERALPIESTVMELDVKEEEQVWAKYGDVIGQKISETGPYTIACIKRSTGIATLLCYLELHADRLLETQSNVYAYCKVQCYGGPTQLQAVAKKCPPVAVAIAKARKEGKSFANSSDIEFSVIEICDMMGWDSGPVKKELKLLQWNLTDAGSGPRKTGVMVEFSQLAYHFRTPGDLTTAELDDILQFLHTRVQRQEKTERFQLSKLYSALKSVSHKNYYVCSDQLDMGRNDRLKAVLNEYFDSQSLDNTDPELPEEEPMPDYSLDQVVGDIRHFHSLYGQEHALNGRAITRIFHGIASPCFPATTWGRVRRFWRCHLDMDFNELMKIATRELINLR